MEIVVPDMVSFQIVVFPTDENSEPFDVEAHNGIILAMDNMKDFYECGDNTGY